MSLSHAYRNALRADARLLWYRVERVLGQGAYGITYLAQDENLRRPVAIKEYLPSHLARREADARVEPLSAELAAEYGEGLRRFISEARTLARFEHPNIVRVHHVFELQGTAYMVMRHEHGESLDRILRARGRLDEAALLALLPGLLDGLAAIHDQACIHRDIKPANILLRPDGTPLLLDFGAARFAPSGEARTLTNFVSPGYAAIEQYSGRSDSQGPWTDLYGLGATLYRALTGRAPPDAVERSQALAERQPDPLHATRDLLAAGCGEVMASALAATLAYGPDERPRSVGAWRTALPPLPLAPARTSTSDPAAPPTLPATADVGQHQWTQPTRTSRGGRTPLLATGLGLLALAALGLNALRLAPALSPAPAPSPQTQAPRSANTAPVPAKADSEALLAARVEALLAAAADDVAAARLTLPSGDNAVEKYRAVLALAPDHKAALEGLGAVARRYVELAQRAIDRGSLRQAEHYLRKSAEIAPGLAAAADVSAKLRRARETRAVASAAAISAPATAPAPAATTPPSATGGRGLFGWFGVGTPSTRAPIEDRSLPVPPAPH